MSSALVIFILLVGILLSFDWLFVLEDILQSDFKDPTSEMLWFLFVLFSLFVGTIVYWIFGKDSKIS